MLIDASDSAGYLQRCQPFQFRWGLPFFFKHFYPFWCPNLATSLFRVSFVPLKLHVLLKTFLYFLYESSYFLDVTVGISVPSGGYRLQALSSRCTSVIALHHTPKMVLRSVIFGTPKSGKLYTSRYIMHTYSTPEYLEKGYLLNNRHF